MINDNLLIIIKWGVTKRGVEYSEEDMDFLLKKSINPVEIESCESRCGLCRHGEILSVLTLFPLVPFAPSLLGGLGHHLFP